MKRTVWLWQLFGFAITALGGTLLHFVYEWTGSSIAALFSGVNESTWEHMKLLFWPMFLFAIFESFFFKDYESFWCIKLRGILLGLALIPIIFYTYNGVIGESADWVNISIFFVCAAIAYFYESGKLKREDILCRSPKAAIFTLCIIALLFAVFTFNAPSLAIFKDPLTGTFGIAYSIRL